MSDRIHTFVAAAAKALRRGIRVKCTLLIKRQRDGLSAIRGESGWNPCNFGQQKIRFLSLMLYHRSLSNIDHSHQTITASALALVKTIVTPFRSTTAIVIAPSLHCPDCQLQPNPSFYSIHFINWWAKCLFSFSQDCSLLSGSLALEALLIGVHCKKRYINV